MYAQAIKDASVLGRDFAAAQKVRSTLNASKSMKSLSPPDVSPRPQPTKLVHVFGYVAFLFMLELAYAVLPSGLIDQLSFELIGSFARGGLALTAQIDIINYGCAMM